MSRSWLPPSVGELERTVALLAQGRWWADGVRLEIAHATCEDGWWLRGVRTIGLHSTQARVYLDGRRFMALSSYGSKGELLEWLDDAIRVIGYRLRERRPAGNWRKFRRPHPLHPMAARGMR